MSDASKPRRRRDGNRAIIYTRQSTEREESISLELQDEACRRHCAQHGYRIVETIPDPGVSGLQFDKRPGIRRVIELVEAGEADVIIVWRWSRLSRRRIHQAVIFDRIERAGGRVESATEPVDDTTAGGRFSREVLLAAAAFESDQKSEQWREAQARRVGMGLPAGGPPPLGYAKNGRQAFVPNPVYGPVVVEMYDAYLRGMGPAGIAKILNDPARGLSAPRGGRFTVSTISRALDSGFAAGFINRHGELVGGAHEALIDADVWARYLEERDRRRQANPNPKSRQPRWFLGAGLAVCGRCGGHMVVDSYRSAKSQAICSSYRGKPGTCDGSWIDRVNLETLVALWLGGRVEEWTQAAEAVHDVDDERVQLTRQIDRERAAEAKLRDGLRRAARLVASGDMTDEDYGDAKREVDTQLREVTARLSELQSRLDALDPAGDAYERLARALGRGAGATTERPVDVAVPFDVPDGAVWPTEETSGMPAEEWHTLLRKIIRRVVVKERHVVVEPWVGEPTVVVKPKPRKRTDVQPRDKKSGRFVKTAA